jgi:hypothetical protein
MTGAIAGDGLLTPNGSCMKPSKIMATIADKQDTGDTNFTRHTRDKNTFATDITTNNGENVNGAKDVTTTASIIVATGMMIEQKTF